MTIISNTYHHYALNSLVCSYQSCKPPFTYTWPQRSDDALVYVQTGTLDFIGEESCLHVQKGEWVYIPCGVCCTIDGKEYAEYYVVHFSFSVSNINTKPSAFSFRGLEPEQVHTTITKVLCSHDHSNKLLDVFLKSYSSPMLSENIRAAAIFCRIWSFIQKEFEKDDRISLGQHIKLLIDESILSPITIEQLCKKLCCSRTKVFSSFKAEFGETPLQYRNKMRLLKARELLRSNDYTISEISGMLSFSSTEYFCTVYKKFFGISPKEDRSKI